MSKHCIRCGRSAPDTDSAEFAEWQTVEGGGDLLCPDCRPDKERADLAHESVHEYLETDELKDEMVAEEFRRNI